MKHRKFIPYLLLTVINIFIACKKDTSCEGCQPNQPTQPIQLTTSTNRAPIAVAGPDQSINLPIDSILLNGSASNDPDGSVTAFQWVKISGPSSFSIVAPGNKQTHVKDLTEGTYLFELKVTDNGGLSAKDTVQIVVMPLTFNPGSSTVYIAGTSNISGQPNDYHAALWKNGVVQTLPDSGFGSYGLSVFVSGSDVYVTGMGPNSSPLGCCNGFYWKNGILEMLGGYGTSVFVSGNDVYVAGGALWKNGFIQNVGGFWPYHVFVSGNDLYLAGYAPGGSGAALWKNGIVQNLGPGDPTGVFVSDIDVYVTGVVANSTPGNHSAILWKNGIAQNLGPGSANSIFVSDSNVYVAGIKNGAATLWKNGLAQNLGSGFANSVFVSGNDVYVVGTKNGTATLWINGTEYPISGLTGANSVFVH
jgi:hypothetical protein